MTSFPLLHAAQAAVGQAPPLQLWLWCFISALLAGALAGAISAHRLPALAARRRIAIRVCAALTGIALVPAVLPYDHLRASRLGEDPAAHAEHCHESPASCADAPVTSGPGQMIDAAPLLAEPAMFSVLLLAAVPLLIGLSRRPNLRPPLRSASFSI